MKYYVFVDNSNVWIEGKFASAVKQGFASNIIEAHRQNICDNSWGMDFGKLLYYVSDCEPQKIEEAVIIGSKPTDKDSLWAAMETAGFRVSNHPRNASNREKKVDTGIVQEINKILYKQSNEGDIFILALGDADYVPTVEAIKEEGRVVKVAFWSNVSGELKAAANEYLDLTNIIEKIQY